MNQTSIEWAEKTWNPISGCTPISEGCQNCYAKRMAQRLRGRCGYPADEPFRVTLHPDRLEEPLRLRKPSRIFVCSMSDLFHEDVPFEFIDQVFDVMATARKHTFMVLTKRPERLLEYARSRTRETGEGYLNEGNVWLGVTAENQARADERIPILLETPAAVRFVSIEPMLGPIDLTTVPRPDNAYFRWRGETGCITDPEEPDDYVYWCKKGIHWVICGGETGPNARPMHPDWVWRLIDQCQAVGAPFMFKQWGEWFPRDQWENNPELVLPDDDAAYHDSPHTHVFDSEDGPCSVHRVGKKAAGRLLDGREWNEYPSMTNAHV